MSSKKPYRINKYGYSTDKFKIRIHGNAEKNDKKNLIVGCPQTDG